MSRRGAAQPDSADELLLLSREIDSGGRGHLEVLFDLSLRQDPLRL